MSAPAKEPQPLGSRSGKRGYIRICVVCGKRLQGVGRRTMYCPDCRAEVNRAKSRERSRRRRSFELEQKARAARPQYTGPSVHDMAAQADAAGLTYGQYVARQK